jgi:hypothetical protein
MWIASTIGFFSVVQDRKDQDRLVVRSRVASDLDRLRDTYLPTLSDTETSDDRDYRYRGRVSKSDLGMAIFDLIGAIDYHNFKDEVKHLQGAPRAAIYSKFWMAGLDLDDIDAKETGRPTWAENFAKGGSAFGAIDTDDNDDWPEPTEAELDEWARKNDHNSDDGPTVRRYPQSKDYLPGSVYNWRGGYDPDEDFDDDDDIEIDEDDIDSPDAPYEEVPN